MTCALLTKAVLHVDSSGSTLEDTESLDNGGGHAVLGLVDIKVAQGAVVNCLSAFPGLVPIIPKYLPSISFGVVLPLGLGTPVLVSGDLNHHKPPG